MSTPDFDAAVERGARSIHDFHNSGVKWEAEQEPLREWNRQSARAALQASGWEEAAEMMRETAADELCRTFAYETCTECLNCRARAWVAQYTPES